MSAPSHFFECVKIATASLPIPIYWLDTNGIILGGNDALLKVVGASSLNDIIGKSGYHLYPKEMADSLFEQNKVVIKMDRLISQQETIKNIITDKVKHFEVIKSPLKDNKGDIIGIVTSLLKDITEAGPPRKKTIFLEDMYRITSLIPTPIYWEDLNSIIMGANKCVIDEIGVASLDDYVGKSLYELYPKEMADHIKKHNEEVIRTGEISSQEEAIVDKQGKLKYYAAVKAPLYDDDGNIIGVVGASVDITKQKELENFKLQEQEKFTKIANQVAHDIRSPLASLLMIVKSCTQIPEADRIALREAAIGIGDIANHLLSQYQKKEADLPESEERQLILVSTALLELLTAKKYQYQSLSVKFDYHFKSNTQFAFIKIEPSAFKRMVSNLMNNAIEALDNKSGKIELKLEVNNEWVKIIIVDSGKGMPLELIDKIMHKTPVTVGKKEGHGIGLTQVWDTLDRNQGELHIHSELGKGTALTLTFPRMRAPQWIAEEILLKPEDIVLILDDDSSIHGAWRTRFEPILNKTNRIQLKHFEQGSEALQFLNNLKLSEKEKVFLLTDYELLKQELNGLHVIAKSGIKRSILVTSHYAHTLIQEQAIKTATKILPKQLASEVPIRIAEIMPIVDSNSAAKADIVIVDDDKSFANNLALFVFEDKIVDQYHDPHHFLQQVHRYPKDTKIYLDNNFNNSHRKGLDIAKELHEQGYQRLYLLSGEAFQKGDIPDYLTVIRKDQIDSITDID